MKPTSVRGLVFAGLASALVVYLLTRVFYSSVPALPHTAPLALLAGAFGDWVLAGSLRDRFRRVPGSRPVPPLLAVRSAALGKASSLVGAIGAGVWLGVLLYVVPALDVAAHRRDALTAGLGLAAAGAFLVSGLRLEMVCRVPDDE